MLRRRWRERWTAEARDCTVVTLTLALCAVTLAVLVFKLDRRSRSNQVGVVLFVAALNAAAACATGVMVVTSKCLGRVLPAVRAPAPLKNPQSGDDGAGAA